MNWQQEKYYFLTAVMFFTRLPVSKALPYSDEILHYSRKYFPLVGVFIGCLAALTLYLTNLVLPVPLAVIFSLVATVLITGAFHEDGFADCCDGFGGGWEKEQVLSIMKDSRVGTYAVVGLILLFAVKIVSLMELGNISLTVIILAYINGHSLSRFGASLCVDILDYVQDSAKSKVKPIAAQKLPFNSIIYSALLIIPAFLLLIIAKPIYIFSLVPMWLTFLFGCRYFKKRIGGYTGDCLGAMQQVLEAVFYVSLIALSLF